MDHLGLVQPVDRLSQRVVVTVAKAAHRRLDSSFGQPFGVADRYVLQATVGVVNQSVFSRPPHMHRLLRCIQHEVRVRRRRHLPTMRRAYTSITKAT